MDKRTARSRPKRVLLRLLLWTLIVPGVALAQNAGTGTVVTESVHSPALEGNLLGDSPDRTVSIYLPADYKKENSRYPVVYLLHGYTGTNKIWTEGDSANVPKIMDRLISNGKVRPLIVVMPDSFNKYAGGFYTNSVTTGNWEDFITHDLVGYVDNKYRTLASAASRGIAGHSMGGYGAIKLAMKHPELYGATYAMSACCLEWGDDLSATNPAWDKTLDFRTVDDFSRARKALESAGPGPGKEDWKAPFFSMVFVAFAAAWSPDPGRPPFFVDFPVEGRGAARRPVEMQQAEWSANMPLAMLGQYRSNLAQLEGIAFDVGSQDEFSHIVAGARDFSRALRQNGIRHEFEEYEGTHGNKIGERLKTKVLPFFSRTLR